MYNYEHSNHINIKLSDPDPRYKEIIHGWTILSGLFKITLIKY